jgi:hypothetical protein
MESRVGILLNDIPEEIRDRVVETLLEQPETYWQELAQRQVRLTVHRLNFRNFVYSGSGKGQLPLPPQPLWAIELDTAGPVRQEIEGFDLVLVDYTFSSTLLTDITSPAEAEPLLAEIDGRWDEPYVLPLAPDLLLQRTGNACVNEGGYPANSYDSENSWVFFDHTCQAESGGPGGCHRLQLPNESCIQAMERRTGVIETNMTFHRLDWDSDLANEVRVGEVTQLEGADMTVIGEDLEDYRVIYRYFSPESCALVEGCVSGSGWRRLLQFKATVHNLGADPLHVGPVNAENPSFNFFRYNSCHDHFHYDGYGSFYLADEDDELASKQAFCVESTNRFSNNEWSPLTHPYTCINQGIQAGWVDEYIAGLDCQWLDITEFEIDAEQDSILLGFAFNPDQFLCEGTLVRDGNGNPVWEPSGQTTDNGQLILRQRCDLVSTSWSSIMQALYCRVPCGLTRLPWGMTQVVVRATSVPLGVYTTDTDDGTISPCRLKLTTKA